MSSYTRLIASQFLPYPPPISNPSLVTFRKYTSANVLPSFACQNTPLAASYGSSIMSITIQSLGSDFFLKLCITPGHVSHSDLSLVTTSTAGSIDGSYIASQAWSVSSTRTFAVLPVLTIHLAMLTHVELLPLSASPHTRIFSRRGVVGCSIFRSRYHFSQAFHVKREP